MKGKKISAVLFLLIIAMFFIGNIPVLWSLFKVEAKAIISLDKANSFMNPNDIESAYNNSFYKKLQLVDINGLTHRCLGQKIVNGSIKDKEGNLNLIENLDYVFDVHEEEKKANKALKILEYAQNNGAHVLYVQRPWKNSESSNVFPYGKRLEYGKQFDFWCTKMESNNLPVVDLRKCLSEQELIFYKTDHHWTIRTSLLATDEIVKKLNKVYGVGLNEDVLNPENYQSDIYPDSLLGSIGVKTGQYYVGKDDFEVIYPKFKTDFDYTIYDNDGLVSKQEGNFVDAFISMDLIQDEGYYNKYAAYTFGGFVENIIKNRQSDNDLKALLISDSFSRPMVTFLSLCFDETRFLDPQEGRYNGSFVEYIKEYKPDVVIMMFPGNGIFQKV